MQPIGIFHLSSLNNLEAKTIHQWAVNEFVVYLVKHQDILEYKTTKEGKEVYSSYIELPSSINLNQMILYLKKCQVMVDENGVTSFFANSYTWRNPKIESKEIVSLLAIHDEASRESDFISSFSNYCNWKDPTIKINLIKGVKGPVWNIFHRFTKQSSFFSFAEATIPSIRCHPETIALIEKIKAESLNNPRSMDCLRKDFKVVRVIDSEMLKEEKFKLCVALDDFRLNNKAALAMLTSGSGCAAGAVYLSSSAIGAGASAVNAFVGGGVFGTLAAGSVGIAAGTLALFSGLLVGTFTAGGIIVYSLIDRINLLTKKNLFLQARVDLLPLEKPLLIEIEPISTPSRIDNRMRVSKFTWAVTLITHAGSNGNHAKIIVEGLNDGFYSNENPRIRNENTVKNGEKFTYMAEFNPPIKSQIFLPTKKLKYDTRTEIWMVTSDRVKKMLASIEEEKSLQQPTFNYWGIYSKIYKLNPWKLDLSGKVGDNCFTWARKKLRILNIDLGEGYTDHLAAIARKYTKEKEEYEILPVQQLI